MKWKLNPARGWDWGYAAVAGLITLLVLLKLPHLHLPFYYDEAWSYTPALKAMYDHGPTLNPAALDPFFTRGHPLLFYFLGSTWLTMFGNSLFSAHSFALFISCFTLLAIYSLGRTILPILPSLAVTLLLMVQEMFLAQSVMFLPEILIALWVMLCLRALFLGKRWLFVIFAACLMMTKESGFTIIAAAALWKLWEFLVARPEDRQFKKLVRDWLWIALPVLVPVLFFTIQRIQLGWVFYPEHVGMMESSPAAYMDKMGMIIIEMVEHQGRFLMTIFFLLVLTVLWKKPGRIEKIVLLSVLLLLSILIRQWRQDELFALLAVPLVLLGSISAYVVKLIREEDERKARWLALMCSFGWVYIAFCLLNFFTGRYNLAILPIYLLIFTMVIFYMLQHVKWLPWVMMAGSIILCFAKVGNNKHIGDITYRYMEVVEGEKQLAKWCEQNLPYDAQIAHGFYWNYTLNNLHTGYLTQGKTFINAYPVPKDKTEYFIVENEAPNFIRDFGLWDCVEKIHEIHHKKFHCRIYKVTHPLVGIEAEMYSKKSK